MNQLPDESISEYFMRLGQCTADCEFQCLNCEDRLTDYVVLRKLMSGLYLAVLKEEVFRRFANFVTVDKLRSYCIVFEAGHKDASVSDGGKKYPRKCSGGGLRPAARRRRHQLVL